MAGGDSHPSCSLPAAGQHNDARMNLAIALTAARYGAATANYTEVLRLLKKTEPGSGKQRVCGARCRDIITGVCLARSCAGGWRREREALMVTIDEPTKERLPRVQWGSISAKLVSGFSLGSWCFGRLSLTSKPCCQAEALL